MNFKRNWGYYLLAATFGLVIGRASINHQPEHVQPTVAQSQSIKDTCHAD